MHGRMIKALEGTVDALKAQLKRMLADGRSDEFVKSFTWAWLRLENTVEMAPDPVGTV